MTVSRFLAIVATVLFVVAFALTLGKSSDARLITELAYLGLASLAGAHAIG